MGKGKGTVAWAERVGMRMHGPFRDMERVVYGWRSDSGEAVRNDTKLRSQEHCCHAKEFGFYSKCNPEN